MATININPVSPDANTSTDFTVVPGGSVTLSLCAASSVVAGCGASIQIKCEAGTYQQIGRLDRDAPLLVLQAAGIFRVVKGSNLHLPFGVDRA